MVAAGNFPRLLSQRRIGDHARLVDWQQLNLHFFNALEVERNVMFLILTLIILVAAFNIITGLTMLVRSKSRDIAVLRTIGASRGTVMRISVENSGEPANGADSCRASSSSMFTPAARSTAVSRARMPGWSIE